MTPLAAQVFGEHVADAHPHKNTTTTTRVLPSVVKLRWWHAGRMSEVRIFATRLHTHRNTAIVQLLQSTFFATRSKQFDGNTRYARTCSATTQYAMQCAMPSRTTSPRTVRHLTCSAILLRTHASLRIPVCMSLRFRSLCGNAATLVNFRVINFQPF